MNNHRNTQKICRNFLSFVGSLQEERMFLAGQLLKHKYLQKIEGVYRQLEAEMQQQLYIKPPSMQKGFLPFSFSFSFNICCLFMLYFGFLQVCKWFMNTVLSNIYLCVLRSDLQYSGSRCHPVRCMTNIVCFSANTLSICSYTAV